MEVELKSRVSPSTRTVPRTSLTASFERAGWILWLLALALFSLPFRLTLVEGRIGEWPSAIVGYDIYLVDLLLAGAILYCLVSRWRKGTRLEVGYQLPVVAAGGLLLWGGLSILWASDATASAYFWLRLAQSVLLAGLSAFYLRRYGTAAAAWALASGGVFQGGLALDQLIEGRVVPLLDGAKLYAVGQPDSSVIETGPGQYLLRAYGTFSHPNLLGGFAVVTSLAALWLVWHSRGIWRGFTMLLAGLNLVALALSFSRSAWAGLLLAAGLSFVLWLGQGRPLPVARYPSKRAAKKARLSDQSQGQRNRRLGGWLALLGMLIALGGALLLPGVQNRLFGLDRPLEQRSIEERVEYAGVAVDLLNHAPLWGVGLNNFTIIQIAREPRIESVWPVHNIPLLLGAELGWPGLGLWLLLPLSLLIYGWDCFTRRKMWSIWAVAGLALVVIGQFDHYLWTLPQGQFLFFGLFGLWLGRLELVKKTSISIFAIIAVFLIGLTLSLFFMVNRGGSKPLGSLVSPPAPTVVPATPAAKATSLAVPATPVIIFTPPRPAVFPVLQGPRGVAGLNVWLYNQDVGPVVNWLGDLQVSWVRHQLPWDIIEPEQGKYKWDEVDKAVEAMRRANVNIMLNPVHSARWACGGCWQGMPNNPTDFANFMGQVARRYKGKVAAYEIWNEANLAQEAGKPINAGRYAELLKAGYSAIKQADPQAIVVLGGLSPNGVNDPDAAIDDVEYLKQLYAYRNGEVKKYYDVLGAHPGSTLNPPDTLWPASPGPGPNWLDHPSFYFRRIEQIRQVMVEAGEAQKQIWLTEFGWASTDKAAPGFGFAQQVSEEQQGQYIARALELGRDKYSWMGVMFLFQLNFAMPSVAPDPEDERIAWGILRRDGSKRPAYYAVRDFTTAKK